jgi:Mrp family chromosome partitioning ATPase
MTEEAPRGSSAAVLPTSDDASTLAWSPAVAKQRGIYGFDSIDSRSRSFNLIRAKLLEFRRDRQWRMIGIVSATPNVGKSFISANIAASLSRDPRLQTYVVDLDLRRGSLTDLFGVNAGNNSLRDYLEEAPGADRPAAVGLEGESLLVMPTVPGLVHSAELLAGARAQNLFRAMRSSDERNYFVLDMPPVFANDDASTTVARLDAYVVVAEEGRTKTREVKDAIALLGENRLAGVIMNKYRGGLMSEGYGVDDYYSAGYGVTRDDPSAQ